MTMSHLLITGESWTGIGAIAAGMARPGYDPVRRSGLAGDVRRDRHGALARWRHGAGLGAHAMGGRPAGPPAAWPGRHRGEDTDGDEILASPAPFAILGPRRLGGGDGVTRSELIGELSAVSGFPGSEAETLVETIFERMAAALVDGEKIEIRGFGTFHLRRRRPRRGRNPRSGTNVDVPAKRVPHFKPGKGIRAVLNDRSRTALLPRSHVSPATP
ncbi:MAG: HU family DNA-binding protein [Candidatus Methylomirabilaceae bacterium]